ncbi:NAD(P)/FAD-dependent oxidoreductase [Methylobacterium sp. WL6]|uniref:FAD-dependent oxidoreductase n=1 Tax=Methylobacterium sp. WL6 TaxID=2603901 RepID=UPI001FEF8BBE|nr:NAD(P)/FAD-dependent oxidoreductase [Methylobacterium sp. WL6]
MPAQTDCFDVVVIGAGLAGTCLAGRLARDGRSVALIDTHTVHPHDFRAEKYGSAQMSLFESLGFGAAARGCTTRTDTVRVVRFGSLAHWERNTEYGAAYPDLINALRADLPAGLLTVGRVADLDLGPERQVVTLGDGRRFAGRLVVLATGLGDVLRRKAGIVRRVIGERHSLAVGFDMAAPRDAFPFRAMTYFSERFGGRDAYLTLFPLGETMRANLFSYQQPNAPWTKAFRAEPEAALRALMPGLAAHCPDLAVAGSVEVRPIDLMRAEGHVRDGVVLVGDAFQTACPIPGTGIGKVLTDVRQLADAHLPGWLATPGMGADKVAAFYADPVKVACDAASLRSSLYARALATETALPWAVRRVRNRVARHAIRYATGASQGAVRAASAVAAHLAL